MKRDCARRSPAVSLFLMERSPLPGLSEALAEGVQDVGEQLVALLCQGEFPLEQGPVVQKCPLVHGVDIHQLGGGGCGGELPAIQPLLDKLGDPLEIKSLLVREGFLVLGDQLGGVQVCQQVEVHAALDHEKELVVQVEQLVVNSHLRIHGHRELFVLLVKQIGESVQECFLPLEIVIKGSFGGLGSVDDVFHGRVVVAVLVKEVPRCLYDSALGGLPFLCHVLIPF